MSQNAQGFASTTNVDASGQGYPVQGMQGQGPTWFGAQWIPHQQTFMQQNVHVRASGFGCASMPGGPRFSTTAAQTIMRLTGTLRCGGKSNKDCSVILRQKIT